MNNAGRIALVITGALTALSPLPSCSGAVSLYTAR